MGSGDGGVRGRENRGREGAGGGSGKERKVPNSKRREVGRKCATMLNISRLKRAKGRKPRKKGLELRKQGTGCTTLFPFPHGSLRVLSKSLLVHALGSKKSSQECLIWGKNVKFNFGKLSPAIFGFHLKFIWETLWPPKIKALQSRSTSKYCAVHICYPAR